MRARTDTTTGMRSAVALAIAASTLLGIAGCSTAAPSTTDGEGVPTETEQSPEFDGAVYDFTQINGIEPASTIRFVIPEEILELESYYAENRVLRSVTAESVDLGSAKFCGIELTYEYASDEVVDRIAATPMDVGGGGGGGLLAETPERKMTFGLGITGYGDLTVGEPPAEPVIESAFATKDYSSLISVRHCAESSTDDDSGVETPIRFNSLADATVGVRDAGNGDFRTSDTKLDEDGYAPKDVLQLDSLAEVSINVMRNGDIAVVSGELSDYKLDANGDWIAF